MNDILMKAQQLKLTYISITDHNTIKAYDEMNTSLFHGIIIPGVEMSAQYQDFEVDILAYGIDMKKFSTCSFLNRLTDKEKLQIERQRLYNMKKVCHKLGLRYTFDLHIEKAHYHANDCIVDDLLSYEENIPYLIQNHIIDRTSFYREHYLIDTSPFFCGTHVSLPHLKAVCDDIHHAGGLCFLAHPYVYGKENILSIIDTMLPYIDGIECYHRLHSMKQINNLLDYCDQHTLFKSGGSDLHLWEHGLGTASFQTTTIPDELIDNWIEYIT